VSLSFRQALLRLAACAADPSLVAGGTQALALGGSGKTGMTSARIAGARL